MLQESLQNGVKHSGAKNFEVTLSGSSRSLELSVKDDGQGFDPKEAPKGKGLGLTGMAERMKLLGGRVHTRYPAYGRNNCSRSHSVQFLNGSVADKRRYRRSGITLILNVRLCD